MADKVSYTDVEQWLGELPVDVFREVEKITDRDAQFNFIVRTSNLEVSVIQRRNGGPLMIATNMTLGGEALEAVHERRTAFFGDVGDVLATAPGLYAYTDESGDPVPNEEFSTVSVKTWIYPDGLSQDRLTSDIIEVVSAITYVQDAARRFVEEAGHSA
ncbi:MAG: hypothetical protein ABEJ79_06880 [Halolamina sp.]